jgi:hypothetical protein
MLKNKYMLLKLKNCTFMFFLPDLAICFSSRSTSICALLFSLRTYLIPLPQIGNQISDRQTELHTDDYGLLLEGARFESQPGHKLS